MAAPRDPQNGLGKKTEISKRELMKKPLLELTDEELEVLEVTFGTTEFPFPMFGTITEEHEGERALERQLTAIADDENPLKIISERPYEEAFGLLMRNVPTRSMLPMFKNILERLEPDSKNRQYFIMGQPGRGKSHTGGAISRIMSSASARVYDCGGKNMNSMLFEMVLDFGAGDALPKQIEERMRAGSLHPMSTGLLRELTKIRITDADGKVVKGEDNKPVTFARELTDGQFEIDWHDLSRSSTSSDAIVNQVYDIIQKISSIEGFDKAGGNMLGMNSQFGPAITDFIEGNFSTWDEYNKSKEGGDDQLQTFLQFLNGEIDECTVENPLKGKDGVSGPESFTFKRKDVKPGWGILLTGNNAIDGKTTRELNKSVYSRLGPEELPEVTEKDWQDFLSSLMTGVPLSILYDCPAYRDLADENPQEFADFLWHIRTAGMSKEQVDAIPEHQKEWIREWKRIYTATEKLGRFYHGWRAALDDENPANTEHMQDIDDPDFAAKQSIDFRRVIKDLEYALKVRAQQKPKSFKVKKLPGKTAFKQAAKRSRKTNKSTTAYFGTRLTNMLNNRMYENSMSLGKKGLYEALQDLATSCDITEINLQEGARSDVRTVESLLNISRGDSTDPAIRAKVAQEIFCKMLRERFPEISEDVSDEDIVTAERMREIMTDLEQKAASARAENVLYLPNQNMDDLHDNPFMTATMFDCMAFGNENQEDPVFDDILTHEEFIEGFVLPGLKDYNMDAIWEDNTSLSLRITEITSQIETLEAQKKKHQDELKATKKGKADVEKELAELETEVGKANLKAKLADIDEDITKISTSIDDAKSEISKKKALIEKAKKEGISAFADDSDEDNSTMSIDMIASSDTTDVAENRSQNGLAITTVSCRVEDGPDATEDDPLMMSNVHVVRSAASDKVLVVANDVRPSLREAFEDAKVVYVSLQEEDAGRKIDAAVSEMLRGMDAETSLKLLKNAFNFRNRALPGEAGVQSPDVTLGSVMAKRGNFDYGKLLETENPQIKFFTKPYVA